MNVNVVGRADTPVLQNRPSRKERVEGLKIGIVGVVVPAWGICLQTESQLRDGRWIHKISISEDSSKSETFDNWILEKCLELAR